jgi:hypothetical protein
MIGELSSEPVREAVGAFQDERCLRDAVGEPLTWLRMNSGCGWRSH